MKTYPVLGVDKSPLVYILSISMRKILIILGVLTIGVVADDWPMFQHDPKHRGRSGEVGPGDSNSYWKTPFEAESEIRTSPIVGAMGEDVLVYIGTQNGRLYAINPTDSPQVEWYYDTPNVIRGIAVDRYGKVVYCGSENLYPLDALTGNPLGWNYGAEFPMSTPITLNGYNIYLGSYRCFHWLKNNGEVVWTYPLGDEVLTSCAPAVDDTGTIYFQTASNLGGGGIYFYALREDGSEAWFVDIGGESSPAIGDNGIIYVGSKDGCIYGIMEGAIAYYREIGAEIKSTPALGKDGRVYIGSDNGHIYCLSPTLDSIIWSYLTGGAIWGAPVIDGAGNVYIGSTDGYLWSFTSEGHLRWKYRTSDPIRYSPAIGPKGIVYVVSGRHLYAIGPGEGIEEKPSPSSSQVLHISPNPFKESPVISFQLPVRGLVNLEIYDRTGRLVKTLVKAKNFEPGSYRLRWDGRDERGEEVPLGIYFCKFSTPSSSIMEKMIMVK